MTTYTTGNVIALATEGFFDDCQFIVKKAFVDENFCEDGLLTLIAANSINIARLLPQSLYYFVAYA